MMASRAPKPRANVRPPADLASRPTHMPPTRPGNANRLAPTPTRARARARAISRSSITALLLHEIVAEAGRRRPQGGLGVDAGAPSQGHDVEQQGADVLVRRGRHVGRRPDL